MKNNTPTLHVFIISWKGQHERAIAIAREVMEVEKNVTIVYSDPNNDIVLDVDCHLIKRSDELFWADKFAACLEACDEDIMLIIHADCSTEHWKNVVKQCKDAHVRVPNIAAWAPLTHGTPFSLRITNISPIDGTPLNIVATIAGIVFSLTRDSVERMKKVDYSLNIYGWGIESLFCSHAFATNKLVVLDRSVVVNHPIGRGYDVHEARKLVDQFLEQFSTAERIQSRLLHSFRVMNVLQLEKQSSQS